MALVKTNVTEQALAPRPRGAEEEDTHKLGETKEAAA